MSCNLPQFEKLLSSKYAAIAIILIASVGVYLNTLWNGFVFDDEFQVVNNPWIKDARYIPDIFLSHVWAFEKMPSNYYRPLMHIILMIDYYIFNLKPWGFHLTNIIFHAGVSVLIFLIASMLFNKLQTQQQSDLSPNTYNLIPAFIAALLFATHPIHTEVVAWVSGIPELSFTFFYLLSFYFYIKADGEYGKHFMLSILFFFLSTLCKETALTLPILLLAYDYSFRNISLSLREHPNSFPLPLWEKVGVRGIIKRYLPYLIVSGIYFILRTFAIGGFAPLKRHAGLSNYQYIINVFPLFVQYLEKLILPINLNAYHVLHPISSILEWKGITSLIITTTFFVGAYFLQNINRSGFFSLLWIVIPILPVLYIPALAENTFAERYLYLPSVGFIIISSILIEKIYQLKIFRHATLPVVVSMLVIVTGLYTIETMQRNYIWKDNVSLWKDVVKKYPDAYKPHYNLGTVYYDKGRIDKAIEHFQTAIRLKPDYSEAHNYLGVAYGSQGRLDDAVQEFRTALRLKPDYVESYNNLGLAYTRQGRLDVALNEFQMALRLKPDYEVAHNNLGNVYYEQNRIDEAIQEFKRALDLAPDFADAHYNLGNSYRRKGLEHEALREFEIALRIRPDFYVARQALESLTGKGFTPPSPTYKEGGANFIQ